MAEGEDCVHLFVFLLPAAQGPRHLMSQNVLFWLGYLEGVLPFVSQGDTVMKFLYSIENKNSANY